MLVNRKRIAMTLPNELVEWLKEYSGKTGIPQTTITERALEAFKEKIEK